MINMTLNVPHLDNSTCCFFEDDPVDNDQTVRQLCCSAMLYISVSECTWTLSALEALRNALYKFKTSLLTYLLTLLIGLCDTPSPLRIASFR